MSDEVTQTVEAPEAPPEAPGDEPRCARCSDLLGAHYLVPAALGAETGHLFVCPTVGYEWLPARTPTPVKKGKR